MGNSGTFTGTKKSIGSRLLWPVLTSAILIGCANPFIDPYGYLPPTGLEIWESGAPVVMPSNAPSLSQGYRPEPADDNGMPSVSQGDLGYSPHLGLDVVEVIGAPVLAAASGAVIESYYEPVYGNHVLIDHGKDVDGQLVRSQYLHLDSRIAAVGDQVVRGQQIGTLGNKGLLAAYLPHLHFEILVSPSTGTQRFMPVEPHLYWVKGIGVVSCFDRSTVWPDTPFRITYPVPCKGVSWRHAPDQ